MESNDNIIQITINDVIFDTARSSIHMWYNTEEDKLSNLRIWSHFSYTSKSKRQWIDDCSYGQCYSYPDGVEDLKELAKSIHEHEWFYTKVYGKWEDRKKLDGDIKTKILNHLYSGRG